MNLQTLNSIALKFSPASMVTSLQIFIILQKVLTLGLVVLQQTNCQEK